MDDVLEGLDEEHWRAEKGKDQQRVEKEKDGE